MTGHHDPDDVLAAVRQMEDDLQEIRRRAGAGPAGVADQIAELREESAAERAALIDDMRLVVEVVATGWQRTAREIESLRAEIGELRGMARGLAGARLELRVAEPPTAARRAASPAGRRPADDVAAARPGKGPARAVLPYPGRSRTDGGGSAPDGGRFERPLYPVADQNGASGS